MVIEHVCPKAQKPVKGEIVGNGTMERTDWKSREGLSGEETKKYKTIIVKCDFCGEKHEYALTLYP